MIKYSVVFILLAMHACQWSDMEPESIFEEDAFNDNVALPFEERLRQYIKYKLKVGDKENYRLKIYREQLNEDTIPDVIVTVNRLEHALQKAARENKTVAAQQVGFFGDYNFLIYYSSQTDSFASPIVVASSPMCELELSFENISSSSHKDIVVDYRIRNSQFRKFYLMLNDSPVYAFHWNRFDGWGTDQLEAYCFDFAPSTHVSPVKDILVYKASMKNISPDDDYYVAKPQIDCTSKLTRRFFYNPSDRKYYTKN